MSLPLYPLASLGASCTVVGLVQMARTLQTVDRLMMWAAVAITGAFTMVSEILRQLNTSDAHGRTVNPERAPTETDSRFHQN